MLPSRRVPLILVLLFIILGFAGLTPTSRDLLRNYPVFDSQTSDVLIGQARGVRWDELTSLSPRILSLAKIQNHLNRENGLNPLLGAGVPANPWGLSSDGKNIITLLLSPHSLPFYLFPGPWGYAASLGLLHALIIATAYLLLRLYRVSLGTPLWTCVALASLASAPPIQRWLVSGIGFSFAYLGPMGAALAWACRAKTKTQYLFSIPLVAWSSACFINIFYPPAQYAWSLLLIPPLVERVFAQPKPWPRLALFSTISLLGIALGLGLVWQSPSITALTDLKLSTLATRHFDGGTYPRKVLLSWLWPRTHYVFNECEDSLSIVGPLLLILGFLSFRHPRQVMQEIQEMRKNTTLITAAFLVLAGLAWMILPIPHETVRWILLDRVHPVRMSLAVTLLLSLTLLYLIGKVLERENSHRPHKIVIILLVVQLLVNTNNGWLWNPLSLVTRWSETKNLTKLRELTGGGSVLASIEAVPGSNLAAEGLHSLLGRIDTVSPELKAFILSTNPETDVSSLTLNELRNRLYAFYNDSWEALPHSQTLNTGLQLNPCDPRWARIGMRNLLVPKEAVALITARCPSEFTQVSLSPTLSILKSTHASPAVMIFPKNWPEPWALSSEYKTNLIEEKSLQHNLPLPLGAFVRWELIVNNEKRVLSYRYKWQQTGLEVELLAGGRPGEAWVAWTALEGLRLADQNRRPELECRRLIEGEFRVEDFPIARNCLFKKISLNSDESKQGVFLTRSR